MSVPLNNRGGVRYVSPTSTEDLPGVCEGLKKAFDSHCTLEYNWRTENLKQLKKLIEDNKSSLIEAVQHDLGKKDPFEVMNSEINFPLSEINETIQNLKKWMDADEVTSNISGLPCSSYIYKVPRGVVLIISPWNYPINLALVPLTGAIAAGCTVFLKLSRHSEKTSYLLGQLIPKYLDRRCIVVDSEGGAPMITALMKQKWDYVFFTGSVDVGRVVYEAAAKNLTPVTLELGGKNPCIVHSDADIELAARRIVWGKFFNNGQTCITSDYLLVQQGVVDKLIRGLKFYINKFFGPNPQKSSSYGRVINERAFERLVGYLKDGTIVEGGTYDKVDKYIAPTIVTNLDLHSGLMTNEIFGPILPIMAYNSIAQAIEFVNSRPLPLALYCFTQDKGVADTVLRHTRSGGACINDLLIHFTNSRLPFGGIGDSGMGQYHGKLTFETFTHRRGVVKSISNSLFDLPVRYPPYSPLKNTIADGMTSGRWLSYGAQAGKVCGLVGTTVAAWMYFQSSSRL